MADANTPRWHQDESGRVHTPLEPVVLGATLLLIPVFILEFEGSGGWKTAAFAVNWLIWGVFAVELAAILIVADRKLRALRVHWLDVAVVVLTVPIFGRFLSSTRFIRLSRLLRLFRAGVIVSRALQAERRFTSPQVFRTVGLFTVFTIFIAGAAEATLDTSDFKSFWDGIWWAVVTVTTVGYGDKVPTTVPGRIIAMLLMFVGIGFLSVLTATIASRFIQTDTASNDMIETLKRIEADVAELKARTSS